MMDDTPEKLRSESSKGHSLPATPLPLPTERPRVDALPASRRKQSAVIPAHCAQMLSATALSLDATFFSAACATLFVLLHRYTGAHDIIIGIPNLQRAFSQHMMGHHILAHHAHLEIHRLLGGLANTFALRVRVNPSSMFSGLLASVSAALLGFRRAFEETSRHAFPSRGVSENASEAQRFQVLFLCASAGSPEASALSEAEPLAP